MADLNLIALMLFLATLAATLALVVADYCKKRVPTKNPTILFLVSAYNDGHSLARTIKSIYDSARGRNFEIIVTNDCSTDNTLQVLESLKKDYKFKLINNPVNLGKHRSINNAFMHSAGELVFIIDSDVVLNKPALDEMLSRLEDGKIGAVSCRYKPTGKGFLSEMQSIEAGMMSAFQTVNNPFSTFTLWGGCSGMKREAFAKVGGLTESAIMDDMDVALKIARSGWKVNECSRYVFVDMPTAYGDWAKRKIRVMTGTMENYIRHAPFFLKHPIFALFAIVYAILSVIFIVSLAGNFNYLVSLALGKAEGISLSAIAAGLFIYPLLSSHCLIINESIKKAPRKLVWMFPFAFYFPFAAIFVVIGCAKGIYRVIAGRKERVW